MEEGKNNVIFAACKNTEMQIENYQLYKHAWISTSDPSLEQRLLPADCHQLLQRGGWLVRNVYNFDSKEPTDFWYVIKDKFGGIEEIPSKYRNNVRKALSYYNIRRCSKEYLVQNAYKVYVAAAESYKIKTKIMTLSQFQAVLQHQGPQWQYWMAEDSQTHQIAAFSMNKVNDVSCNYSVLKAIPSHMKEHSVYYGLIFEMNRYYLQECGLQYVNDGARSVSNHSDIQGFLMSKFRFRKAYCNICITYQPWLKYVVRILFPFRKYVMHKGLRALLNMESMQRNTKHEQSKSDAIKENGI